jgi:hypothetical protein
MDYVLHEDPTAFKRKGGVIEHCPSCKSNDKPSSEMEDKLEAASEVGDMLGDDVDGYAAMLEDFGLTD